MTTGDSSVSDLWHQTGITGMGLFQHQEDSKVEMIKAIMDQDLLWQTPLKAGTVRQRAYWSHSLFGCPPDSCSTCILWLAETRENILNLHKATSSRDIEQDNRDKRKQWPSLGRKWSVENKNTYKKFLPSHYTQGTSSHRNFLLLI